MTTKRNDKCRWRVSPGYVDTGVGILPDILISIAILGGFMLRIRQYFFNRSLWLDEAFIAVAVRDSSWADACVSPLEYSHIVPPLFAAMSKFAITVLGPQDYIFCLIPLFFGCASLVLFYYLVKQLFKQKWELILLAVTVFALSPTLLYFTTEFKQYIGDVFATVLCLLVWALWRVDTGSMFRYWMLVLVGVVCVWLSQPVVFVLAGIGMDTCFVAIKEKQLKLLIRIFLCGGLWLISFGLVYLIFIRPAVINNPVYPCLKHFWGECWGGFAPVHVKNFLPWLMEKLTRMCDGYYGIPLDPRLFVGLLCAGYLTIIIYNRPFALVCSISFFITVFCSAFEIYPFEGRMIMFLRPMFILVLVMAVGLLERLFCQLFKIKQSWIAGILLSIVIFYPFAYKGGRLILFPLLGQEIKPILQYVQKERCDKDAVYIYYWSEPAFRFYGRDYGFDPDQFACLEPTDPYLFYNEVLYRRDNKEYHPLDFENQNCFFASDSVEVHNFRIDMERMKTKGRFWFIVSHIELHNLHKVYAILDEMGIDFSKQFNTHGANAMLCIATDNKQVSQK